MNPELALIRRGVITADEYVEALLRRENERPRMGQVAIEEGLLTARQVLDILAQQYAHPGRRFGEIAIEIGELTEAQVEDLLLAQEGRQRPVFDHLIEMGCVTREAIEPANQQAGGRLRDLAMA